VASATSAPPAPAPRRDSPLLETVRQWNEAILSRNRDAMEQVYAEQVAFYGQRLPREKVITSKLASLEKAPGYSQSLEDLRIEQRDSESPVIVFEKHWIANAKPGKVSARLTLRREHSRWVVAEETDLPTIARFSRTTPYSEACQEAVMKLVATTDEGHGYLMSRGPSPDYPANSARFETDDWPKPRVAIQENNEGYRVTLAWFQVDVVALTVVEDLTGSGEPLRTQAAARDAVKAACKRSPSGG